jgi:two-component system cell cycle sensor histidine kinase/response regulator CckA
MTKRILVAEDEPLVRKITVRVLHEAGYEAQGAEDGETALELATGDEPFDLLIVDQRMPRLLGDELIERARARWPDQPVIRLLGNPDDADARPVDVTCVTLRKPYTPPQLLAAVEACLNEGRGPGRAGS